jgi:hypothetical protein
MCNMHTSPISSVFKCKARNSNTHITTNQNHSENFNIITHQEKKKKKLTQVLVWLPRNREKETSEPSDRIPSSHLFPHISQQPNKTDNKLRAEA